MATFLLEINPIAHHFSSPAPDCPAFVGICGTDLHEYLGGPNFCPASRHPVTGDAIPVTLGHEFSGVIKEIGSNVRADHLKIGLPCAVQPTVYCGKCAACDAGAENACHTGGFIGLSGGGGGLSEAVSVPADQVFPLPEGCLSSWAHWWSRFLLLGMPSLPVPSHLSRRLW
ncbi:(R,R)-butanediol dehydrogenase [Colletotrichum liriopes]|uniref:(R,R)-butanediol dehydrogenase n=1 Tax=Colletotrichum liriopes TaxID=708192 RepID=A0AA37GEA5_9PEZI|nr:(R,R)-butanediol dehydrogenase [Colletotrichum liriopes]